MNERRPGFWSRHHPDHRVLCAVVVVATILICGLHFDLPRHRAEASALPPGLRLGYGGTAPIASGYPALPPPNDLAPLFPLFMELLVEYVALDDAKKAPFPVWIIFKKGVDDAPTFAGLVELYIWHKHVVDYWNRWGWPG